MAEKVVKELGNGMVEISTTVKDGEKTVPLTYKVPALSTFKAWFAKLPDTAETGPSVEQVHERYCYATDLKERAGVRESVAAESTVGVSRNTG